jgi:hypothetical protein
MSNRPALVRQSDALRIFKAARTAGYGRTRLVVHPDGRVEYIAETGEAPEADNALDAWRRANGKG